MCANIKTRYKEKSAETIKHRSIPTLMSNTALTSRVKLEVLEVVVDDSMQTHGELQRDGVKGVAFESLMDAVQDCVQV